MRTCAYCGGSDSPLTNEHLFSGFLEDGGYKTYVDRTRRVVSRRAPRIGDVCERCNNEQLSALDSYGAELHRRHFSRLVDTPIDVTFQYDFDRLLRWLLKIAYNHDRAKRLPVDAYLPLLAYVVGEKKQRPAAATIHFGIIAPVPTETPVERQLGPTWYPQLHAFGELRSPPKVATALALGRLLSFNSYVFRLLLWKRRTGRPERRYLASRIAETDRLIELPSQADRIRVRTAYMDVRTFLTPMLLAEALQSVTRGDLRRVKGR
jgi:hypothetical protein